MAVPAVFVSSVQRGFERERVVVRDTLRALQIHPLMAETTSASSSSPQRALLDQVALGDYFLLLLGLRYGDVGSAGTSPTEDEFNEANRLGKPIIVLVQEGDLESAQLKFLERVRSGGWEGGLLYATFHDAQSIGPAVAGAFAKLGDGAGGEDVDAALAAAGEAALRGFRSGGHSGGVLARIAIVPTTHATLLDPLALENPALPDTLASLVRECGLAPQRIGLSVDVSGQGVTVRGTAPLDGIEALVDVAVDGAVLAQSSVRGTGGHFAGLIIEPERLRLLIQGAGSFALAVWEHIDQRQEIRRAAVQVAIPGAEYMGFGQTPVSSMSLGGRVPAVVQVPIPPQVFTRGELVTPEMARRLVAAVRRVFADAGRVYE